MDKQQLKTHIKEWVKLDDEISQYKQQIRDLNLKKKKLSEQLLSVMKEQEIDAFDLNNEGKLIRQVRKTKSPLTKKYILTSLVNYFKDDDKAKEASNYILDSRTLKMNESICKK
jgi:seryl-tRNA synthetase